MIPAMETPLTIADTAILPGETHEIRIKLSESHGSIPVYMPVTVIRGVQPGPTVFFTAAVHGDEINGVEIVRTLTQRLSPEQLRGTVVNVPIVNVLGFNNHERCLPDGRDLNRTFPGSATGSQTSRIAHLIYHEVIRHCQFGIDFHTAAHGRHNMPHIRANVEDEETLRLARAFGARVILHGQGRRGSLRREAARGCVPTIVFEAGEAGRFERSAVTHGVNGACNVLHELRMLDWQPVSPIYQVIARTGEWIRAPRGGILSAAIDLGDLVYKGQDIGVISNPYGRELTSVRAPFTGIVVGLTVSPLMNPGSPICHMVKVERALEEVEKALALESTVTEGGSRKERKPPRRS